MSSSLHQRPRERLAARLSAPTDAASLGAFRLGFGMVLLLAIVRAWQKGVIEQAFVAPQFFFPYYGFSFIESPGRLGYPLYALLFSLACALTLGVYTRLAAALFCVLFSYLHFVDATNYLNHYYLVSLLSALFACLPTGDFAALNRTKPRVTQVPRWVLALFRFQLAVVYFFGGVAKLKSDWLFHAQPLRTWLAANTELPVLGPMFQLTASAYVMSWLGALYDLSIPFALSYRRTRPYAYLAVVAFHLLTARLFQIGIFPYLMIVGSLLFLDPDWPRRFMRSALGEARVAHIPMSRVRATLLAAYVALQLLLPLRHLLYPGNVLWTEQGYRFAWHVMLMEKSGAAEFRIVDRKSGRSSLAFPRTLLSRQQTKAMATQPDMILAFAHELARREREHGREVAVYADVFVVLNGRPPRRFIDPTIDLARVRESFAPKPWILPGP